MRGGFGGWFGVGGGGFEFDDEFCAGGVVLFGADGALVLLDDFGGDGEAEACAALLGGEVGEEEALAHFVGEAGAGVGDGELDHAGGEQVGGDAEFAEEGLLHGFGGVVDEVAEGALHGFGVGEDEREVGREALDEADVLEAAGEEGERVLDDGIEVGGAGLRGGEFGERGELVDEGAHAFDRRRDDFTGAADDGDGGGFDLRSAEGDAEAVDVAVDLFRAEGDGGERILDFVGDPAGDFFPCGLLLRAEEFGGVFEDEDVAVVGARGAGAGFEQRYCGEEIHGGGGVAVAGADDGHLHFA